LLYFEHSERKSINTREVWQFDISLDTLLKEDSKMVQSMDKERAMGIIKHEKSKSDKKAVQYIKEHD
jgi:hypothetical protein